MAVVDDKSEHCIPFLVERLEKHHDKDAAPFFLGLNGVQGAGKTTLVSALKSTLASAPHDMRLAVLSLDDFYLTHGDQTALATTHPTNPLVQHRGQPATHDLALLTNTLASLRARALTNLPAYDKSQFAGAGDRADPSTWLAVNGPGEKSVDVVILEGWCVGFQALSDAALEAKWKAAKDAEDAGKGVGQLGKLKLEDVRFVNDMLKQYGDVWKLFDAFVHIDAAETGYVYDWRLEAEVKMRETKGVENAMTDEQVKKFVDGYYPAYELYTETLRKGIFSEPKKQLRLVVGKNRRVQKVELI